MRIHKHGFTMNLLFFILFTNALANSDEDSRYIDLLPDEEKTDFLEKVASKIERDEENEAEENNGDTDLMEDHNEFFDPMFKEETSDTRRQANETDQNQKYLQSAEVFVTPLKTQTNETIRRIDLKKRSVENNQELIRSNQPEYIKVEIVTEKLQINNAGNKNKNTTASDLEVITPSTSEPISKNISNSKAKRSNSEATITENVNTEDFSTTNSYNATSEGYSSEFENQTVLNNTEDEITTEPDLEMTNSSIIESSPKQSEENVSSTTVKDETNVTNECVGENCTMRSIYNTTAMLEDETTVSSTSEENSNETALQIDESSLKPSTFKEKDEIKEVILESTTITNDFEFVDENNKTKNVFRTNKDNSALHSVKNETFSDNIHDVTTAINFNILNENNKQHVVTPNTTLESVDSTTHITTIDTTLTKPTLLDEGTEKPILRIGKNTLEKIKKLVGKKQNNPPESFEDFKLDDLATIKGKNTILLIDGDSLPFIENVPNDEYNKKENSIPVGVLTTVKPKKVNNKVKAGQKGNKNPGSIKIEVKFPWQANKKMKDTSKTTYQVYEIAPDQPPFIKSEPLQAAEQPYAEEQPYYVPIYNYAPNKAYYNPVNRFGPNEALSNEHDNIFDDTEGQFNGDKFFHYDIKNYEDEIREYEKHMKNTRPNDLRYISNELDSLQSENQPILKLIDDYLDDYYYGRNHNRQQKKSLRRVPPPDENLVNYDDKNRNMKNDLNVARNILNQQSHYGVIANPKKDLLKDIRNLTSTNFGGFREKDKIKIIKSPTKQVSSDDNGVTNKKVIKLKAVDDDYNIMNEHNDNKDDGKVDKVKDILNMTPNTDLIPVLFQLQEKNLTLMRRVEDLNINAYLNVIRDMMIMDNKRLEKYDWLKTTVCIQSKIQKLFAMIRVLKLRKDIHPDDLEVIKYIMFLYNVVNDVNSNSFGKQLRSLIPKPKKKREIRQNIALKGFSNRVWLIRNQPVRKENTEFLETSNDLRKIEVILNNVADKLYGLHTAIKNIAKVTTFKKQNWFKNLKELYLSTEDKYLLELLLHLSASQVCNLLENSTKNGLEKNFVKYVLQNEHTVRNTAEELVFAINVMNAMKNK